jgi:hypothetical protein
MHEPSPLWRLDPDDPRAPSREVWERMSEAERQRVVDELPKKPTDPIKAMRLGFRADCE